MTTTPFHSTAKLLHEAEYQLELNAEEEGECEETRALHKYLRRAARSEYSATEIEALRKWALYHPSDDDGWTSRAAHRRAVRAGMARLELEARKSAD